MGQTLEESLHLGFRMERQIQPSQNTPNPYVTSHYNLAARQPSASASKFFKESSHLPRPTPTSSP